jgi:hypothetical protein
VALNPLRDIGGFWLLDDQCQEGGDIRKESLIQRAVIRVMSVRETVR